MTTHENGIVVGKTFDLWLKKFAQDLEEGKYAYSEHFGSMEEREEEEE